MAAKDQNCSDKFTQLYLQYYQNMIRYATSIVKLVNIAEELVHDAYIKIPRLLVPKDICLSLFEMSALIIC